MSNEVVPTITVNETELSRFCKTHLILGRSTNEVHADYVKFCDGEPLSKTEFSKQIKKELNCVIVDKRVNGEKRRIFKKDR